MADNRNEIYDDESEGQGFYRKDRGVKNDTEARQGSLEEAENQATEGAPAGRDVTNNEAAAAGFSYKPDGTKDSFVKRQISGQLKKKLLGGGAAASLAGIVISLFISFLPLKIEFIVQNITSRVSAATYQTIEDRMETVLGKYLTKRLITDRAGTNTYTGNSLFGSLYGNWRGSQFEEVLERQHGIRFQALINGQPVDSNDIVPNGWRVLQDGEVRGSFPLEDGRINLDLLDRDLNSREMRRAIRQATRETTKWYQVLKRRNLRRIMVNKFDVPDWKVPNSVRNAQASYSARKVEAKKWLVRRTIGPFSARYAALFTCILDSRECSDLYKQNDPNLSSNLPDDSGAPREPQQSDFTYCPVALVNGSCPVAELPDNQAYQEAYDQWTQDYADWADDAFASKADDISDPGTVDELTDTIDEDVLSSADSSPDGSSADNFLARFMTAEFMKKLTTGAAIIGLVDILAQIDLCLEDGYCAKALTDMNIGNYVSAAAPFLTTNSQMLSGELDAESVGLLIDSLDGMETHPIYAAEFGTLRQTAWLGGSAFAQSGSARTIAYDCDGDPLTPDEVIPLDRPVCDFQVARNDFGSWTSNEAYQFFDPIFDFWRSTGGIVLDWFDSIIDFVLGPIINYLFDLFPQFSEWLQSAVEWAIGMVFSPTCTGAEKGGNMYNCIRGGIEATYAQIGEEAVNGIGGEYLTDEQWKLLQSEYEKQLAWEWQQESLTTRIFSRDSHRSLLAKAIINTPHSVPGAVENIASIVTNPLRTVGSMFGNFSQPVSAVTTGFNPYGFVRYGYTASDPAMLADPEESPLFADCELNVLPQSYDDPHDREGSLQQIPESVDPNAPPWPVYTKTDPCALERTVVEIGSALFGSESGGLSYDYHDDGGAEFYAGEIDEVFGIENYAGASW